jgi:hypothetical protein
MLLSISFVSLKRQALHLAPSFEPVKILLLLFACTALALGTQGQVLRSATDRAAQLHWYQQTLNEREGNPRNRANPWFK